jgi:hypothetical protein
MTCEELFVSAVTLIVTALSGGLIGWMIGSRSRDK